MFQHDNALVHKLCAVKTWFKSRYKLAEVKRKMPFEKPFGSVSKTSVTKRGPSASHTQFSLLNNLRILSDGRVEMETRGFQEKADDGPHNAARCGLRHSLLNGSLLAHLAVKRYTKMPWQTQLTYVPDEPLQHALLSFV